MISESALPEKEKEKEKEKEHQQHQHQQHKTKRNNNHKKIMPPKKTAKRRSRKETLQEDLTKIIDEFNMNDEEVFPILKEALSEGVDVNLIIDTSSLICHFALWGMLKCFEECFLRGADPTIVTSDDNSIDALVSAVSGFASAAMSHRMVVSLSTHVKFNDMQQKEAAQRSCDNCRFEVVRLLLRRNNSFADKVLWLGVHRGSVELVEDALEFNAGVNQRLPDGQHLIHMAAEYQDSSILQKLLDAGANIEAKNKADETPFEVAIRFNSVSCVRLLIGRKRDFSNSDALLLAVRCRSHDVLKDLLSNDKFCVVKENPAMVLFEAVTRDDLTAFKIIYPIFKFCSSDILQLIRMGKYDMLSAVLFEFEHPRLSIKLLTQFIVSAPNDDFKALLQKKIDLLNGVDLAAKVKKEAEEDDDEELQSTSKTKKHTTKTTTKSKKK